MQYIQESHSGRTFFWVTEGHMWNQSTVVSVHALLVTISKIFHSNFPLWNMAQPPKSLMQTFSVQVKNKTNVQELKLITKDTSESSQTCFSFPVFY